MSFTNELIKIFIYHKNIILNDMKLYSFQNKN